MACIRASSRRSKRRRCRCFDAARNPAPARRYPCGDAGIEQAVAGKSLDDYQTDWLLRHALQRAIEIISEASRALPDDIKALRPEVPWPQVKAIGNVLRHEYHGLSEQILWGVIADEIPRPRIAIDDLSARFANG
jgi:uncharacterized protein with HEPN domain